MATKYSKTKNIILASDNKPITKPENAAKDTSLIPNALVASDDTCEAGIWNVDASDDSISEKQDKKLTGLDLRVSMQKLNIVSKKKLLVLPIGGFLVYRAHRRRPSNIPKHRRPDFYSGNFMSK